MTELFKVMATGITAFCATNLDDILILMLFFAQVNSEFRRRHIVAGQYLGFGALVLASMTGFFGHFFFPQSWIGLLGIVPLTIGVSRLINRNSDEDEEDSTSEAEFAPPNNSLLGALLSPQTYTVAAVTFANGGDNIGIYVPLFANSSWQGLGIILAEFFLLVGVWCYTAYQLTRFQLVAVNLTRYGNILVPFVLIGLGILILIDSHTLENRGLTVLALIISGVTILSLTKKSETSPLPEQVKQIIK